MARTALEVTTADFLEFERRIDEFQREPVEITRAGRREFVLLPADHCDRLRAAAKRSHRTMDAADVVIVAAEHSEMIQDLSKTKILQGNRIGRIVSDTEGRKLLDAITVDGESGDWVESHFVGVQCVSQRAVLNRLP